MRRVLLIASLFCGFNVAYANSTGTLTKIAVSSSGYQVFVKMSGPVDPVSCRTRTDWDYFLDLTAQGSKEILSALLAAKAAGQTVEIQSTLTCDSGGNGLEVIGYVIIH